MLNVFFLMIMCRSTVKGRIGPSWPGTSVHQGSQPPGAADAREDQLQRTEGEGEGGLRRLP